MINPVHRLMSHFGCATRDELAALIGRSHHAVEKWQEKRRVPPIRREEFEALAVEMGKPIRDPDFWSWCDATDTPSSRTAA